MTLRWRIGLRLRGLVANRRGLRRHGGDALVLAAEAARDRLGRTLGHPADEGAWVAWSAVPLTGLGMGLVRAAATTSIGSLLIASSLVRHATTVVHLATRLRKGPRCAAIGPVAAEVFSR